MPDPTTLLEYADARKTAAQSAVGAAQTAVVAAQVAVEAARNALSGATSAAAALADQIAQKRATLPDAPPADAAALVSEITALTIEWRQEQATLLQRGDELADAQSGADVARAKLTAATARLADASAAHDAAVAQDSQRQAWKAALAGPLASLHDDAGTALGEDPFTAAEARVAALPAELVGAASGACDATASALVQFQGEVGAARDALGVHNRTQHGAVGAAREKQMLFERAQALVRDYAGLARGRFEGALAALAAVAATPLLTADEDAAATDAALEADRVAAATALATRDARRKDADAARAEYENAYVAKQAANPQADVTGMDPLPGLKTTLDDANQAADDAQTAYAPMAADFQGWAAVVPDDAWRRLRAFHEAQATLQTLSTGKTAAELSSDMDAAEGALVAALLAVQPDQWTEDYLADALAGRQARLDRATATLHDRLISAMRGDA